MLDWWKKLLKRLNTDEEMEELIEPDKKYERKNHVHTKVTYQYPSKAPFRFPVIPDEKGERLVRSHTTKQEKKEIHEEKRSHKRVHIEREVKKKPFVPTQVPSPIYGFGKRNKEIDTVPAYIRKSEEKDNTTQSTNRMADIQVPFHPLKKVDEAPYVQLKNADLMQSYSSTGNVVHLKDYDSKVKQPEEEGHEENLTFISVEEEVAATLVSMEESLVETEEQEAMFEQKNMIPESSLDITVRDIYDGSDEDDIQESEEGQSVDELNFRVIDDVLEEANLEITVEKIEGNEKAISTGGTEHAKHNEEQALPILEDEYEEVEKHENAILVGEGGQFKYNEELEASILEDEHEEVEKDENVILVGEMEQVNHRSSVMPRGDTEQVENKQEKLIDVLEEKNQVETNLITEIHGQIRERPVPFNVMMTSQDQFFLKLQREKKAKEEKRRKLVEVKKDTYIPNHLLDDPVPENNEDELWLIDQQELLEQTLKHFNVRASVVKVTQGPTVTRFEVQPELGVKVSKVRNLSDDIKLNMSAKDIRIEAPIPGKNTIGIEVPNLNAHMVGLQEIFETDDFKKNASPLTIGLGLSVEGLPVISDIAKMPHGLIAGATGSGKSVCINTILLSILYKASYKDVKLLLIDPKMVELAPYNGLPHLVSPVITDVKAATAALKWAVEEMEDRYEKFVKESVRDIGRYNKKIKEQHRHDEKMPYIVIVIDELADLMMASPQDVEDSICRIAQKARACGIHLLLATQRPSVDVITGLIKANVPTRIAFSVSSQVDSRTIIDMNGAERLLGKGDMLFIENGASKSIRLQGAFVSDEEIERITNYVRKMAPPHYLFEQEQLIQMEMSEAEDELLDDAVQFVIRQNQASTSLLQRQFRIGYNRAARLIDTLESRGIISGQNGSKPRDVLLSKTQVEEMYPY